MTAMTKAIGLPAGTTAALVAQSSTTPAATVPVWSVVVLLVGLAVVIGWALYVRAVRVDRLHRQVLGSRATLEAQLVHRAEAAADLATTRALDPASSLLLAQAAREALDAEGPIVDDGLDGLPLDVARGAASDRRTIESSMSRTLRLTVDELEEEDVSAESKRLLDKLSRARLDVRLTRTFHNSHVDQIRRVRRSFYVRLFFLAGRAPTPATVDIDDE